MGRDNKGTGREEESWRCKCEWKRKMGKGLDAAEGIKGGEGKEREEFVIKMGRREKTEK